MMDKEINTFMSSREQFLGLLCLRWSFHSLPETSNHSAQEYSDLCIGLISHRFRTARTSGLR